jgi:hypothetical protein
MSPSVYWSVGFGRNTRHSETALKLGRSPSEGPWRRMALRFGNAHSGHDGIDRPYSGLVLRWKTDAEHLLAFPFASCFRLRYAEAERMRLFQQVQPNRPADFKTRANGGDHAR